MYYYVKTLQYPISIKHKNPAMAKNIISQYGGPDGELGASLRYLSQRYTMPCEKGRSLLTDIATEELAHVEIIQSMIKGLTKGATIVSSDIKSLCFPINNFPLTPASKSSPNLMENDFESVILYSFSI